MAWRARHHYSAALKYSGFSEMAGGVAAVLAAISAAKCIYSGYQCQCNQSASVSSAWLYQ